MTSLCSLVVYPAVKSLKFSKLPKRRMIATQNPLSLTNRKPQIAIAPLIKSDCSFMTSTAGYTQESRAILSNLFATNDSFLVSNSMTTTVSPPQILQVFINFRGDQLRYNFISHLVNAFERHEIKFFIDKDEQLGKDRQHLFVRIKESKIGFPIFSTRYPESKWFMNELVKMIKHAEDGKLTLIPVFYKVKPSDVRKPTRESEFDKNFWKLMEKSDQSDPIQEWRKAFGGITNTMGLCLRDKRYISFQFKLDDLVFRRSFYLSSPLYKQNSDHLCCSTLQKHNNQVMQKQRKNIVLHE